MDVVFCDICDKSFNLAKAMHEARGFDILLNHVFDEHLPRETRPVAPAHWLGRRCFCGRHFGIAGSFVYHWHTDHDNENILTAYHAYLLGVKP